MGWASKSYYRVQGVEVKCRVVVRKGFIGDVLGSVAEWIGRYLSFRK